TRPPGLDLGMTAEVEIDPDPLEGVVTVPLAAVASFNGADHVAVRKSDGGWEARAVLLGLSDGTQAEVRLGLASGETVPLAPPPRGRGDRPVGPPHRRALPSSQRRKRLPLPPRFPPELFSSFKPSRLRIAQSSSGPARRSESPSSRRRDLPKRRSRRPPIPIG